MMVPKKRDYKEYLKHVHCAISSVVIGDDSHNNLKARNGVHLTQVTIGEGCGHWQKV